MLSGVAAPMIRISCRARPGCHSEQGENSGKTVGHPPRALGRTILLLTGNNRAELHGSTGFATHKSGLPQPRVARFTGTANLVANSRT